MRLPRVERGRGLAGRVRLLARRLRIGYRVPDLDRLLLYRPRLFGSHFLAYAQAAMRGPSIWTVGERELFATFTSQLMQCPYCVESHRAIANQSYAAEVVNAVLADWRTAPVRDGLRLTLGFLEKITLQPAEVDGRDVAALREAGVSDDAIREALHVRTVFAVITRVANALAFEMPAASVLDLRARLVRTTGALVAAGVDQLPAAW